MRAAQGPRMSHVLHHHLPSPSPHSPPEVPLPPRDKCLPLCSQPLPESAHITRALSFQALQLGKQGVSVHVLPGSSLAIFTPSESPPRKFTCSSRGGMLLSLVTHSGGSRSILPPGSSYRIEETALQHPTQEASRQSWAGTGRGGEVLPGSAMCTWGPWATLCISLWCPCLHPGLWLPFLEVVLPR